MRLPPTRASRKSSCRRFQSGRLRAHVRAQLRHQELCEVFPAPNGRCSMHRAADQLSFWAGPGGESTILKARRRNEAATKHRRPPAAFGPLPGSHDNL